MYFILELKKNRGKNRKGERFQREEILWYLFEKNCEVI